MTTSLLGRAALVCSTLLTALPAVAAGERNAAAPHVVEIHVDGKPQAVAQTRTVATEILLRVSVVPVVLGDDAVAPNYATPGEPFVRAYFDFRSPGPRLVIVDGKTQRELERRVLPEGASLETSVESVTHVLYMVVESLLDEAAREQPQQPDSARPPEAPAPKQAPLNPPPVAPKPAAAESPASPRRSSGLGVEGGVLFRTMYLGETRLQPGAGLALDFRSDRANPHLSMALGMAIHTPVDLSLDGASARLQPFSFALLPSLQGELGSGLAGLFGVGASMTWFSLSTSTPDGVRGAQSAGGADLAIAAVAGIRLRLSSRVAATLSGALDVDSDATRLRR
ncbi:MAG: hypothetical protein QM756_29495 [Polyangiaceae bacterium]